jgi:hypothetical protein
MFEIGLIVALVGGLLGVGLSRDRVKRRFPAVGDYHLDIVAVILLVVGLALSAFDHYGSELALRESESKIRTLGLEMNINVSAKWKDSKIPDLSTAIMLSATRACSADFVLHGNKLVNVEFHRAENVKLLPGDSDTTEITYYSNGIPGADVYSLQPRSIEAIRNFGFTCIFNPDRLENPSITIHRVHVTFFVNGRHSFSFEVRPELTTTYRDSEGRARWWTILDCGKITHLN